MTTRMQCDIAIIGGGSGGLSVAAVASQLGLKVVLLEANKMGGDCLNYGCVPSKSLLSVAKRIYQAQRLQAVGYSVSQADFDFKKVIAHVNAVIAEIAVHDSVARFEALGVHVIQAVASFVDRQTVRAGSYRIKARRVVIATGSAPVIPPIPGLETTTFLTNETIFSLDTLPTHLIVIGGGPIGAELAQAFAMLGSKVSIVEGLHILNQEDKDAVAVVRQSMIDMEISLYEHSMVKKVVSDDYGVCVHVEREGKDVQISGSHLLIATGRKPNIQGLHCEKAGIQQRDSGIIVNARLQTSNKRVYAIGDVIGQFPFTHIANAHAGIVLRNIAFKIPAKVYTHALPRVTYTQPELAHVGLSKQQCKDKSVQYRCIKLPYTANDRALAESQREGFIEVYLSAKGKPLGVTIVGHEAGELITAWESIIREGRSLRSLTNAIVAYPTFSEINKRVASQYFAPKLFSVKLRKLVRFINYFNW